MDPNECTAMTNLVRMVVQNVIKDQTVRNIVQEVLDITLAGVYTLYMKGDDPCTDDDGSPDDAA